MQEWEALGLDHMRLVQKMRPEGLPCAFIQVTRFNCGGLVVAVCSNHTLADGKSLFHFMTAWSDLSRTGKTDKVMDHNRGAIQSSTPRPLPSEFVLTLAHPERRMKCYEVNASVVEELKREVKESADGAYVSTNDCIYAHLWKSVSSLPYSINAGKDIGMASIVEGRERFYPQPVPNLLGNVWTFMTPPRIPTADLVKMPVSAIARKIREKLLSAKRETWLSPETRADFVALVTDYQNTIPWVVSSWISFPMYSIDFGFGKPLFLTGINNAKQVNGAIFVHPPEPGVASSAATLGIVFKDAEILEALERDTDFLSFFLPMDSQKTYSGSQI
jgi:hypothetical protein